MPIGNATWGDFVADSEVEMVRDTRAVVGSTCFRTDVDAPNGVLYMCVALPHTVPTNWAPYADVIAGIGGGGMTYGGGGAGGSDPTAWGAFVGSLPGTVTIDGVTWTIAARDSNNRITKYEVVLGGGTLNLIQLVGYNNGYPEYSGNYYKGGAVVMTLPQLKALRDEVLVPGGLLCRGFRARNEGASDADCFAYVISSTGVKTYRSSVWEWDGYMLSPQEGASRSDLQPKTWANSSVESGALSTIAIPGWLVQPGLTLITESGSTADAAGTSSTLTARVKINATEVANGVGSAGGTPSTTIAHRLRALTATSQYGPNSSAGQTGSYSASSSAAILLAVNTAAADFTVTTTLQMSVADKTATQQFARCYLERS